MVTVTDNIQEAAQYLQQNDVVGIPTETVYGLAGNIYSEKAIRKIFAVKQRPLFNPLIVHLPNVARLHEVVSEIPPKAKDLAKHFWPGPLTLILKKKDSIPDLITAGKDTVAVRIPQHPTTLALLNALPFPLAAPSANPFNRISPTTADHVAAYFKNEIPMVLDGGPCQRGLESTIVGFENGQPILYRLGAISKEALEAVVGPISVQSKAEKAPQAPGMLAKHYAPKTKMHLHSNILPFLDQHKDQRIGVLSLKKHFDHPAVVHNEVLSQTGDLEEAAANLYGALHRLDSHNLDLIVAERMPNSGLGLSINDRLERATQ